MIFARPFAGARQFFVAVLECLPSHYKLSAFHAKNDIHPFSLTRETRIAMDTEKELGRIQPCQKQSAVGGFAPPTQPKEEFYRSLTGYDTNNVPGNIWLFPSHGYIASNERMGCYFLSSVYWEDTVPMFSFSWSGKEKAMQRQLETSRRNSEISNYLLHDPLLPMGFTFAQRRNYADHLAQKGATSSDGKTSGNDGSNPADNEEFDFIDDD